MSSIDPYQLLGVTSKSNIKELKKNYYSLALICHPDRGGNTNDMVTLYKAYLYVKQQLQFVAILLQNKRINLVKNILQHYIDLSNIAHKTQPATIISAHNLNKQQQQDIIKALTTKTGTKIEASFVIDKHIIGGLIIKVKDQVIDKSISGMLTQMKHQIIQTKDISYAT